MQQPTLTEPPEFIKLLAHDLRWQLLRSLTASDLRVQELVNVVQQPMNLVSYHLRKLRDAHVVTTRRSEADGRDIYYSLDLTQLRDRLNTAGRALHPGLTLAQPAQALKPASPLRVLFLCTHNSARSQMAEALLRHAGAGQISVFSAGTEPASVHPDAIRTMDALGIPIHDQQAKHVDQFSDQAFDYVVTVCDHAREVCPTFPGQAVQIHWGYPDPTDIEDETERLHSFMQTAQALQQRIRFFLADLYAASA